MKRFKRISALILASVLAFSLAACKSNNDSKNATEAPVSTEATAVTNSDTPDDNVTDPTDAPATDENNDGDEKVLVIAVDATFSEKWNPFIVESAFDHQVIDQVFTPISQLNAENRVEDLAGHIASEEQADGSVLYTVTIQEGMRFTDGTPITIEDFIYNFYVRADPSYNGPGSLLASTIAGIKEYYYDDANYSTKTAEIEEAGKKMATDAITLEDFTAYAKETNLDGWWQGKPDGDVGDGRTWSKYITDAKNYDADLAAIDATNADAMLELLIKVEYETSLSGYDVEAWWVKKAKNDYAQENISEGISVPTISGITKIDDFTCTVLDTTIDIYGDRMATRNLTGNLVPKHYYGEVTKGDVSKIISNMKPMGSGPYIFEGFSDNIATCVANDDYFLGKPKTKTVRWQSISAADVVESLASGTIDICNPVGNKSNVEEMDRLGLRYDLIDNAGYGYMAMNTERMELNVRKGVWSIMNRRPSVEGFYGPTIAKVIERPMTTVLAEYPQDANEYYEYSPEKALEYFTAAGYTQVDGKLVNSVGKQLVLNAYIGGDGRGDHPAYSMLVQAAADLEKLGGEIQILDVNFAVLTAAIDDRTADMWIMAWGAVTTCDKTTQFHSNGGQNNYLIKDAKLDTLLENIPQTLDFDARKTMVAEMLDLAMDLCVEYPLYQRNNLLAYNEDTVNMDTIPTATAFYDYKDELWKIEMK